MAAVSNQFAKLRTFVSNPRKYLVIPSICALAVLAFCFHLFVLGSALLRPYSGLDRGVYWNPLLGEVIDVAADSPAARDGLRAGDRITTLIYMEDGFLAVFDQPGRSILLHFIQPRFEDLVKRLVPLLTAFLFFIPAFYYWARNPYNQALIILVLASQFGALAITGERLNMLYPLHSQDWIDYGIFTTITGACYLHLHILFPRKRLPPKMEIAITLSIYAVMFYLAPIHDKEIFWPEAWQYFLARNGDRLFLVTSIILSISLLVYSYVSTKIHSDRKSIIKVCSQICPSQVHSFVPYTPLGFPSCPLIFVSNWPRKRG
jgi:hypothetical protein